MKLKRTISSVLAMCMLMCTAPSAGVFAEGEENSVTVSFAAYDGVEKKFLFMDRELEISEGIAEANGLNNAVAGTMVGGADHGVEDGEITALDALVAAHIQRDGSLDNMGGTSTWISKMFGTEASIGFSIDGKIPVGDVSDGYSVNEYVLNDGDTVIFFTYADPYWGDYTSYFDKNSVTVNQYEDFTLALEGYAVMDTMMSNPGEPTPEIIAKDITNANICIVNAETGAMEQIEGLTTDENGEFTYSFEEAGEYIISALATVEGEYGTVPVSAPLCFVDVEAIDTYKLTVPEYAEAKGFKQVKNYKVEELEAVKIEDNDDETVSYIFDVSDGVSKCSYRVSAEDKITKAGYMKENAELNVSWTDDDYAPDAKVEYDSETTYGSRADDSLLLNINSKGHLIMEPDETYRMRAFRIWQIINSDSANMMIEPDFKYEILSGEDVIEITSVEEGNGNAKNNWLDITAKGEGTAIVEVGYDAVNIVTGSFGTALDNFTFGACNQDRTGLVIIQTANAAEDVDFGIKSFSMDGALTAEDGTTVQWDSEFDTLYFTDEYAVLEFAPEAENIEKVEYSNDKGVNWYQANSHSGVYTARILSGNNILRVTKTDGTTAYQIVRGKKVTSEITNLTDEEISAGDTVRVELHGVHFPVGKMAGIYNPSFMSGIKLAYTFNEQTVKIDTAYQYNFPTNAYIDVVIPEDAQDGESLVLSDGYIAFSNWGSAPGVHRTLTDEGAVTNVSAPSSDFTRCILPDITIAVGDSAQSDGSEDSEDDGYQEDLEDSIDVSDLEFDLSDDETEGYVIVSFEDFGERVKNESGIKYKDELGEIIEAVEVPFEANDTAADVTMRLLDALELEYSYSGTAKNDFYLSSIGGFALGGEYYKEFGEFDAGAGSGFMYTINKWFANEPASEIEVADGDMIVWKYTCQFGADIGCDNENKSAEIIGLSFKNDYGELSPSFNKKKEEYTYTIPKKTDEICLEAELENYWTKVTYEVDDAEYRPMEAIPVSSGTVITIRSEYIEFAGDEPIDSDYIKIKIKKESSSNSQSSSNSDKKTTTNIQLAVTNQPVTNVNKPIFPDVAEGSWYYDSVKYVKNKNFMNGTDNGFEPDSFMTRAMLVTVLYRMSGEDSVIVQTPFEDVKLGEWYTDAVLWAAEKGIVNGVSNSCFAPNENITREQMASVIYRYARHVGYDVQKTGDLKKYYDYSQISDWALEALSWANGAEIMTGTSETTVSPKTGATRAQIAVILMRLDNLA